MSIRVLQVIGGSKFGGAIWVMLSYVEALQEHGCAVAVCTSVERVAEVFRGAGCEIVSVPEMVREIDPWRDARSIIKLAGICRDGRFDVVHTHTSKGGVLGRAAARLAGTPIVIHTAHGFAFHEASPSASILFYTLLERLAAQWCDRVITVSDFHRAWAIRLGITTPERVVTIRNGISRSRLAVKRSRQEVRKELGVEEHEFLLASTGRLAPEKGLETLIGVLPDILRRSPRARVVLVGEGPLRADLESLVANTGLSSAVHFLGFRGDVGEILNASDVLVAPTLREGLSVSVLEAMAMGKPIVTTTIGSNRELIEDRVSGLLVPPNDPAWLAEAILQLEADPRSAARYGDAAKQRFELYFTEQAMKQSIWSLYRQLLHEKLAAKAALLEAP